VRRSTLVYDEQVDETETERQRERQQTCGSKTRASRAASRRGRRSLTAPNACRVCTNATMESRAPAAAAAAAAAAATSLTNAIARPPATRQLERSSAQDDDDNMPASSANCKPLAPLTYFPRASILSWLLAWRSSRVVKRDVFLNDARHAAAAADCTFIAFRRKSGEKSLV